MIDRQTALGGRPLCLVLEEGDLTVADLMTKRPLSSMEQKMLLYQVILLWANTRWQHHRLFAGS